MHTLTPFIAGLLGLGGGEMILIFGILMLLFGGSKLPELAKGLGKSIKEFKQASRDEPDAPAPQPAPRPAEASTASTTAPAAAKPPSA